MYGSTFSDTVSSKVSRAIDPLSSVTDPAFQVLMQTYIPRIDLTTALNPAAREAKAEKGSKGRTRCSDTV